MDDIPHMALPIRLNNGQYATRQQDTDAEAADCVKVILSFGRGERIEEPDFGIEDPTFQTQPISTTDIEWAIQEYEPRVQATVRTVDTPDGSTSVSVKVTLPTSDELPTEE
jgi:phage baseplate assembly protein W